MNGAGKRSPWPCAARPPMEFVDVISEVAAGLHPDHFRGWVTGRLDGLDAGCVWERYCALVSSGEMGSDIFSAPTDLPVVPLSEPPETRDFVADITTIPKSGVQPGQYDVFISYKLVSNRGRCDLATR